MKTDYTNIKHFTFSSVHSSTITRIVNGETNNGDLISFEIMEDQFNGIEVKLDKNYFINSLIPFLSELNDKEKETFKNWLGE
jgi:hypothetical protein